MSKKTDNISSTPPRTISEKLEAFEQLVAWFNTEDFSLQQALGKFEEAEKLAHDIETELAHIKNSVEVLKTKFDDSRA